MDRPGISRRTGPVAAVAVVLAACGGAELLLPLVVTPLNGAWVNEAAAAETLRFESLPADDYLYKPAYAVEATYAPVDATECQSITALEGTLDNGVVVLYPKGAAARVACLTGTFTDLRTLKIASPGKPERTFRNGRVDVQMANGIWVSENGAVRLKFTDPFSVNNDFNEDAFGCDVSGGSPANFTGSMAGFNTATDAPPQIAQLRVGTTVRYRDVVFRDGATLEARDASGQALTLKRQKDTAATTCPP